MYVSLLLLYVLLERVLSTQTDEQPYCSLRYRRLCQGKGRHVACQFPLPGPGMSCQNYTQIKFTYELRHFITHYINRRRQRVASGSERVRGGAHLPRPEIMMLVTWDKELAHLAQRLADQCHFVHDDCRATVRYPYAGQSVGEVRWRCSDEMSAQRAVRRVLDAWWGERRRVQPKQLTTPFRLTAKGTVWGHFSQLAVWSLRAIGCAAVAHGRDYTRLLLVCDFSHTNMLGQKTISPGPMAPCPIHTVRKARTAYPLLCVPVKRPIPQETKEDKDNYDEEIDEQEDDTDETTYQVIRTRTSFAPAHRYTETSVRLNTRSLISRKNTLIGYLVMSDDKKTSRRSVDMFEQDLDQSHEDQQAITLRKFSYWPSKRPHIEEIREDEDPEERKWLKGHKELMRVTHEDEVSRPEYYRRRVSPHTEDVFSHAALRHRWKQTRLRPKRVLQCMCLWLLLWSWDPSTDRRELLLSFIQKGNPFSEDAAWSKRTVEQGFRKYLETFKHRKFASAIFIPTSHLLAIYYIVGDHTYPASLMLDQDDVDQLFRDTGFNVNWRQSLTK